MPAPDFSRRNLLRRSLAAVAAGGMTAVAKAVIQPAEKKQWLLFTRSQGFEHDVIKGSPSTLFKAISPAFAKADIELSETKDGSMFEADKLAKYAGVVFYTTGDLTKPGGDNQPPMSQAGHDNLIAAVRGGMPFIGLHCASDTLTPHHLKTPPGEPLDDYVKMLGGAFEAHGEQQDATVRLFDDSFAKFNGDSWKLHEEWYALQHVARDISPILMLETAGMKGDMYQRAAYPIAWTRTEGRGRVFYTGLGHRPDVLEGELFQTLLAGAIRHCAAVPATGPAR